MNKICLNQTISFFHQTVPLQQDLCELSRTRITPGAMEMEWCLCSCKLHVYCCSACPADRVKHTSVHYENVYLRRKISLPWQHWGTG